MALIAHFETENMTTEMYAEVLRQLAAAGLAAPAGRIHHASYGDRERLCVVDIYDTEENFQAFGAKLQPVLQKVGVRLKPPAVSAVHNIIRQ